MVAIFVAVIALVSGLATAIFGVCFIAEMSHLVTGIIMLVGGVIITAISLWFIPVAMNIFEKSLLNSWAQARFVGRKPSDD
jgi:hypothetical protein